MPPLEAATPPFSVERFAFPPHPVLRAPQASPLELAAQLNEGALLDVGEARRAPLLAAVGAQPRAALGVRCDLRVDGESRLGVEPAEYLRGDRIRGVIRDVAGDERGDGTDRVHAHAGRRGSRTRRRSDITFSSR